MMKSSSVAMFRFSLLAAVVLALWSVFFYFTIIGEVNDETDDSLEDYAEFVMRRHLAGEELPSHSIGSNNQYFLQPLTAVQARQLRRIEYKNREVFIEDKDEYEPARVVSYIFQDARGDWFRIEVSTPTIDKDDLKAAIFGCMVALYVAIMVTFLLLNGLAMRYSMRLRQSEELVRRQKGFIGNASHELQTPIAACQNRLEMILDDGDNLSEHQVGELLKIRRTLDHTALLNRNLLLLAKIDNGQYDDVSEVDMGAALAQVLDDVRTLYRQMDVKVEANLRESCRVRMSRALAMQLCANLVKNAYVHNVRQGVIRIKVERSGFSVENTGAPQPLNATDAFTPFHHDPAKPESMGLGLPIVAAICQQYGLSVAYRFVRQHHVFEVRRA